ncbi:MAG: VOC family protein [Protaetiibacter sp.]
MENTPRLIDHVAVLVDDLEESIGKWSAMLGYTFGPITRYRTSSWVDSSQSDAHFHDARVAFSKEGPPRIELMEVTGEGTHSLRERGFHHLGFVRVERVDELKKAFESTGVTTDGAALDESGRAILWFTDKNELDGIRLEFVGTDRQPIVLDDGREIPRDENGRLDFSRL